MEVVNTSVVISKVSNESIGANLRVYQIKDESFFLAKEVSDYLDYAQTQSMLNIVDDMEVKSLKSLESLAGHDINVFEDLHPMSKFITEAGLYQATFSSTKLAARQFRIWVTKEVLPSIRRTGSYGTPTNTVPVEEFNKVKEVLMTHTKILVDLTNAVGNLTGNFTGRETRQQVTPQTPRTRVMHDPNSRYADISYKEFLTVREARRVYPELSAIPSNYSVGRMLTNICEDHGFRLIDSLSGKKARAYERKAFAFLCQEKPWLLEDLMY